MMKRPLDASGVLGFIAPERRARYRELLATERGRRKFADALPHFKHFDKRYIVPIQARQHSAAAVEKLLRANGAPDLCYVSANSSDLDGQRLPLEEALRRIVGFEEGTIVICKPDTLGFYEGEEGRFMLKVPE